MPETKLVALEKLSLDLENFRTVRQTSESSAIKAMVAISPDYFWALTESLLDSGYLPTENIIAIRSGTQLVVREGNRRVAALKLIHKQIQVRGLDIPDNVKKAISKVTKDWRSSNASVPCAIYTAADGDTVDRIVALTHGKGERAGRDKWTAVATARHARDKNGVAQPALDLLEHYLKVGGGNLTVVQKVRWEGVYSLSVLDEAIKKLAPRLGYDSSSALAKAYPDIKHRKAFETIMHGIGLDLIMFKHVREPGFADGLGIPPLVKQSNSQAAGSKAGPNSAAAVTTGAGAPLPRTGPRPSATATTKSAGATSINDPATVMKLLKSLELNGPNREKVVSLRDEALKLKIASTPIAFCFLLRSMFEISASAYCVDHAASGGPSTKTSKGEERTLAQILTAITVHLVAGTTDKTRAKTLHGANTELTKSDRFLSVTSLNQLVHNPKFSILPSDICTVFGNVFPLLQAMNA